MAKRLSRKQQHDLQHRIADLGLKVGLHGWRIIVEREYADPDAAAQSFIQRRSDFATVRFGRHFFECDPLEQTRTILHELLHCHFQRPSGLTQDIAEANLPKAARKVFRHAYQNEEERAIDRLADSLADAFAAE